MSLQHSNSESTIDRNSCSQNQLSCDDYDQASSSSTINSFCYSNDDVPGAWSPTADTLPFNRSTLCHYCTKTFVDPRILECIHTFCLQCLQELQKNNDGTNQRMIRCPTCRQFSSLPPGGVIQLPRNCLMDCRVAKEQLLAACSVDRHLTCGFQRCALRNSMTSASVYCTVCRTALCDQCITTHRTSGMGSHNLEDVPDGRIDAANIDQYIISYCEVHDTEPLNVYCTKCSAVVCARCFIAKHNGHSYSNVDELAQVFRRRLTKEVDCATAVVEFDRKRLEIMHRGRIKTTENVERIKDTIVKCSEDLKKRVDSEKNDLLRRLKVFAEDELAKLTRTRQEIENGVELRMRFVKYASEIIEEGSPVELARSAVDVESRAAGIGRTASKRNVPTVSISFNQASIGKKNLIGALNLTESTKVIKP